ncbi:MAG: methyltransferase domain-containing protein, partial [Betaproteobacteria bacterium]|nr:methyltransferase domain-containing protein [Betaproteobacteria bacterium]
MSDWSQGYAAALPYTYGFHRELAPTLLRTALLAQGVQHDAAAQGYRFCELGCGRGLDCNILAAANPESGFWGADFNPAHIADARELARAAGSGNVHFLEADFEGFGRQDLPDFDFIVLHGVYTWVSPENRQVIGHFIAEHLRPGGVVYLSYNALPGWAQLQPLGRLIHELVDAGTGPIDARVAGAIRLAGQLRNADAHYFRANPQVGPLLDDVARRSDAYIVHEYCNRDWTPLFHADVARAMAAAKLEFAASADLRDQVESLDLTPEQSALLRGAATSSQREMLRDFLVQRRLRRDVYVKGARALSHAAAQSAWAGLRLALVVPRNAVTEAVAGDAGSLPLASEIHVPILDRLARGSATVAALCAADARIAVLDTAALREAILLLIGAGFVEPCLPVDGDAARALATRRLNRAILERARWSGEIRHLASPVTGSGVAVARHDQLFLLAGLERHADATGFVAAALAAQGVQLVRDGRALGAEAEIRDELGARHRR